MNKLDKALIEEIANKYGTPTYVYNLDSISKNYMSMKNAFTKYYPKTKIHYSVKSNSNLHVLKFIASLGAGADCASPFELMISEKAGFNHKDTLYTGNYESLDDLLLATQKAKYINLDDVSSLDKLLGFHKPEIISFRINPGIGKGGFEGIVTGGADAKFGIPYEKTEFIYKKAIESGINRFGVHIMAGSNNLEPYYFAEIVDKLMNIIGPIFRDLSIKPEYIDIGGGFGIPYSDDEQSLDIDLTAKLICAEFTEKLNKYGLGEPELFLEPGRYLTAQSGVLISKVVGIKKSYRNFVGLDCGMNSLLRPALYGAEHRIEFLSDSTQTIKANICGQICENSDIFLKNVIIPEPKLNDLALIHDTGAYGYAMASNYNGRSRPSEVILDKSNHYLSRKRDEFDNLLVNYVNL